MASNDGRASLKVTRAPRRTSSSAAAMPLRAAPSTTTFRPRTLKPSSPMPSPQLQRGETEKREQDADDHEPRDHLRLAPANQLEVMMQRRHLEDALAAGGLEVGDLHDHRERLE